MIMSRNNSLRIRLTNDEKFRLRYAAQKRGITMSEIIQDFCKQLPLPCEDGSENLSSVSSSTARK